MLSKQLSMEKKEPEIIFKTQNRKMNISGYLNIATKL